MFSTPAGAPPTVKGAAISESIPAIASMKSGSSSVLARNWVSPARTARAITPWSSEKPSRTSS
jgi:hypothetical protein